jgi:formamidopyrimidine-DNA glycosylase
MPELPEVETSRRGIEPWLVDTTITDVVVRDRRLRWPVARGIEKRLSGQSIQSVGRRAKYLLINTTGGTAIVHLGMTGSVFIVDTGTPAGIHDHFDIALDSGKSLRFRDPRRFGSFLFSKTPLAHPLLATLGPEPLGDAFDGAYLWQKSRGRRVSVKQFIMNAHVVVGVGNI